MYQCPFQHVGLGVHTVQNRMVAVLFASFHLFQNSIRNIGRLVRFVCCSVPRDLLPRSGIGPEMFGLSAGIVGNHAVGSVQNVLGGTIILFQTNHGAVRKFFFESENIFDRRSAEPVDTLLIITHNTKVSAGMSQQRNQLILSMVRVLILVHQYIGKTVLILCQFLRKPPEQFHSQVNNIVKIQSVGFPQMPLVRRIQSGNRLLAVVFSGIFPHFLRRDHRIFGVADLLYDTPRRELLFGNIAVCKAAFHQLSGIVRIINGKVTAVSQPFDASPQDLYTGRVECGGMHGRCQFLSQGACQTCPHFSGSLIGKGDRQNIPRADRGNCQYLPQAFHVFRFFSVNVGLQPDDIFFWQVAVCLCVAVTKINHVDNSADNGGGLAAAGTGEHQNRSVYGKNRLLLLFIQRMKIFSECLLF